MLDYADRDGVIWMDGEFVPWRQATLPFLTHSLHYGSAVYEGIRAYGGSIFKLREHNARLARSAEILGYEIPFSAAEIDAACREVLVRNDLSEGYIRPAAWRGTGVGLSPAGVGVRLAIAAWDWPSYFTPEQRMKGVRLSWSRWRRPAPDTAPTGAKASGLYQICTIAKHEAETSGFDDALMLDYRGLVAEATGANVFLVIGGQLHTPIPDCFLDGITRQTVIALAREAGIEVVERHISPDELRSASEVFLTGTAAEITPVARIGDLYFSPGSICRAMIDAYTAVAHTPALEDVVLG